MLHRSNYRKQMKNEYETDCFISLEPACPKGNI